MQNSARGAGLVLTGFLTLVLLVLVGERAGLPVALAEAAVLLLMVLTLAGLACMGRTAQEASFSGQFPVPSPLLSGLIAGGVLTGMGMALQRPVSDGAFMSILFGQVLGIACAHGLARWHWRRGGQTMQGENGGQGIAILSGVLQGMAGVSLALMVIALMAHDLMTALAPYGVTLSLMTAGLLCLCLPVLALVAGGMRACLMLLTGIVVLAVAGYSAILATGLAGLGALPLPGFSESATLAAIANAKARWFPMPVHPLSLSQWPTIAMVFSQAYWVQFLGSASISCFFMLALAPALPVRRRRFVAPALAASVILPLCIVVAGGYAIEAAGFQFVGASAQRPPAGLLEASRAGLVSLCNAAPVTVDALRAACKVSPRDAMLLDWQQIGLGQAFLRGGVLAAMGFPVAPGVLARAAEFLLLLAALVVALWIAARSLGYRVLARDRMAPGLASVRLGFVRLAGLLLATALVAVTALLPQPLPHLWEITAIAAGVSVAMIVLSQWLSSPLPVQKPTQTPARRKPAVSGSSQPT